MEVGDVKQAREIAREEGIGNRYVSRMVNMTTLVRAGYDLNALIAGITPENRHGESEF